MRKMRLAIALGLLCSAPQLWAQTVKVNWQMGAPFASYKTYAWQDPKNPGLPFYGQWVKPDVIAQLNAKGLSPVAAGQTPDLIVTDERRIRCRPEAVGRRMGIVWRLGRLGRVARRVHNFHFGAPARNGDSDG